MHENRESSWMSWLPQQDRSAKAINRTADMNVQEQSDCVVLPMNQPNKEGQPSVEVGKGRTQTEENIVPSHMHPTQSGNRMSQGLNGVRKAAKERKQERFTALLHHMSVDLLRDSFFALKRKAAPGVDGVTWQEYETGLEDRLVDLHSRVHRGAYRAQPSRRVYIPKPDGRQRPLAVATAPSNCTPVPSAFRIGLSHPSLSSTLRSSLCCPEGQKSFGRRDSEFAPRRSGVVRPTARMDRLGASRHSDGAHRRAAVAGRRLRPIGAGRTRHAVDTQRWGLTNGPHPESIGHLFDSVRSTCQMCRLRPCANAAASSCVACPKSRKFCAVH